MSATLLAPFDANAVELRIDPYPTYARYREADPVHLGSSIDPDARGAWYLFGFDDGERVLVDTDTFRSNPASIGKDHAHLPPGWEVVGHVFQRFLGGIDPPEHDRLRGLLRRAFSPRQIDKLESQVRAVADSLFEQTFALRGHEFDAVGEFAFPFPMLVIADILGVAPQHRDMFKNASSAIADAIDDPADPARTAAGSAAVSDLLEHFRELIAERRAHPRPDVLSGMIEAARQDESLLSEEQLLAIAVELLVAGHETTVNAINFAIFGLHRDLDSARTLAAAEVGELAGQVEELLRWTSPSQRQRPRWASHDVQVGGRQILRGEPVVVVTGAANRDPARFPDPDRIVFDRPRNSTSHLAFGRGAHFCLGANLARLELRLAMPRIAAVMDQLDVPDREAVLWRPNTLLPGPVAIPVRRAG